MFQKNKFLRLLATYEKECGPIKQKANNKK